MKTKRYFNLLPIKYKLLISYSVVFIISITVGYSIIYSVIRRTIESNIESELQNSTNTILNMVKTVTTASIKNHLRAVAEKNREIVQYYFQLYQQGKISEAEAKQRAAAVLLSQKIGESGYIYCLDSNGIVVVHPKKQLLNVNVSEYAFIKTQKEFKKGYLEYDWKNPEETQSRPKALYMSYFEAWDWIISVSAYRSEFKSLVNIDDFRDSILSLKFGKSGYSFIGDIDGNSIIHPKIQGMNILTDTETPNEFFKEMIQRKNGKIFYSWRNPDEAVARKKLVMFNFLPEFQWIVASYSYLDEIYAPLKTIRQLVLVTVCISLLLVLPITFRISLTITRPLHSLMRFLETNASGDSGLGVQEKSMDETWLLTAYFVAFLDRLKQYKAGIKKEILDRQQAEDALRQSEQKYRLLMDATPDPIAVYDMQGRVVYLNPAFNRVFGWNLDNCLGKKMDHFVPEENWAETHVMIRKLLSGQIVHTTETRRLTREGSVLFISISATPYRDQNGDLMGSITILKDITEAKRLERTVMDIGEIERRKIGQDLHDDLCPHLIGVEGMSRVLKNKLAEKSLTESSMADQIAELVKLAIDKTRNLARILCPVFMVSRGLESALKELAANVESISRIPCRFTCDAPVVFKNESVFINLFYITQEAVHNAAKHSGADTISINLSTAGEIVRLNVTDDGSGMTNKSEDTGIGMQIMRYRANMIGAQLEIKPNSEQGTIVQVTIRHDLDQPDSW